VRRDGSPKPKDGEKKIYAEGRGDTDRAEKKRCKLTGANRLLRLQNHKGERRYREAGFNPVECRIAFEQEGRGYHGQCKNKRPENGLLVVGLHTRSVAWLRRAKPAALEPKAAAPGTFPCFSLEAAALILARWIIENPPELVAQSRPGSALHKGQTKLLGLVASTSSRSFDFATAAACHTH
jgi:hypothetical protein